MSNHCISLLGNPIPDYFEKIDNNLYQDALNALAFVRNGLVFHASVGVNFSTLFEGARFFMVFHRYFENDWESVEELDGDYYIFQFHGVYATLNAPRRQGGQLFSSVIFSNTLE